MKIILVAISICTLVSLFSCKKSSNNSRDNSYSGPKQCLSNTSSKSSSNLIENIVGGTTVTNAGTILTGSNTVAIILESKNGQEEILCTGSIVASNLILTAGHCFDSVDLNSTSPGSVVFANSYLNSNNNNSAKISCWQRPTNYVPCSVDDSYNCILNDITWVKINGNINNFTNYTTVPILSNPKAISATEPKWMLGFGLLNDNQNNVSGNKYVVQSLTSSTYPDTLPSNAVNSFNTLTFSNAYEQYLTVIGPNNQTNPGKGTCEGDSGGPVYVSRSGSYVLAALTQGSNSLLSPHPTNSSPPYTFDTSNYANCNDGYGVYTTVGNYVNWITTTSGVNLSTY